MPPEWADYGPRILTSDTLFEQQGLSSVITVVGLGAIGLELGHALTFKLDQSMGPTHEHTEGNQQRKLKGERTRSIVEVANALDSEKKEQTGVRQHRRSWKRKQTAISVESE